MERNAPSVSPGPVPSRSPLTAGYLARNPLLVGGLRTVDTLLAPLSLGARGRSPVDPPRRILIAIGGHLGDAVIASSVLPDVASVWPGVEIGVLAGSWSRPVLEGHPLVRWIHTVDHWKLLRSGGGRLARYRRYAETRRTALAEIVAVGYDVAVDLCPFFPNAIPLLWRARIPVRVGHTTGGFAPLLTHSVPWWDSEAHMAEHHRELLGVLDPRFTTSRSPRYSLPPLRRRETEDPVPAGDYLVLHMGAGLPLKEWPADRWHTLVGELLSEGYTLVFTGSGAQQAADAERAIAGRAGCHNLCDRLGWDAFVATIAGASLVVSVDSVAGHLAAATETPVIVLASGMNRIGQWRPLAERVRTLTRPMACAPCHRSRGCEGMECIRGIEVHEVLDAVRGVAPQPEGVREAR